MLQEKLKNLRISSVVVIFDRDFGKLIFKDIKVYENLVDDAEWLLERTPQRSWGFMIRPVIQERRYGLWVGEYMPNDNKIIREEMLFGKNSSIISKLLLKYAENKIREREIDRRINIEMLKKMLPESNIIRDFKYFSCPEEWFYSKCPSIEEIYKIIEKKYGRAQRLHYSWVDEIISSVDKCHDVIVCPLRASPNSLERILILNKAIHSRRIGEIEIVDKSTVRVSRP